MKRIVLIAGFESFNANLYRQAGVMATARCEKLEVIVFSDRDITTTPDKVETALQSADVFFGSLIFDYDQVMWLRERVQDIPIRLVFESALELMSLTQLGKFAIGDQPKGMPKPVKFILSKFGNSKEEDKLAGYISFLKTGPKLLKYIPGKKVQDLRNWLIIYGYWNAGGAENVAAMCWTLAEKYLGLTVGDIPQPIETPNMGLLHPEYQGYFTSPQDYLNWYQYHVALKDDAKLVPWHTASHRANGRSPLHRETPLPTIGILLYRKHVITKQPYIPQLIKHFASQGLIPLPIFINGVEGHVAVRDWMTTTYEQEQRQQGNKEILSLKDD
ncbi:MAG: magnesium chelatase subunit, partial [Cyanobacteriota bacterium]